MFYANRLILSLIVSVLFSGAAFALETVEFDSTVVSSASYDKDSQVLTIRKVNEAEIVYGGVPEKIFTGLVDARLKGGYYRGFIEGEFEVVSKEGANPDITLPSPVSDAPVNPDAVKQEVLKNLRSADSTLNRIRTTVPGVDDPRKKIAEALSLVEGGEELDKAASLIRSANSSVRSLESRYAKEVSDAKAELRTLEMKGLDENALPISRTKNLIDQLDPVVSDLIRASKSLKSAESALKKMP